jgi:hypothetical protein
VEGCGGPHRLSPVNGLQEVEVAHHHEYSVLQYVFNTFYKVFAGVLCYRENLLRMSMRVSPIFFMQVTQMDRLAD